VANCFEVSRPGSLNTLTKRAIKTPELSEQKVLVSVKSIGLNYADIFAIMGLYSAAPKGPFVPGLEYCGEVEMSRSPRFQPGQKVIGVTRFGGYATQIVADPDYLFPLPADWSFQHGAAYPVQALTAYYALKTLGDLQRDQAVLIHSAAGGVGIQAIRMARKLGAYTIGVVGSAAKLQTITNEHVDKTIVRGRSFESDLRSALDGRELNLVLETTGGTYFTKSYKALAPMGRLVAYGSAEFTPSSSRPNYLSLAFRYLFRPRIDPLSMITANKSVMAFNLIWLYERQQLMQSLLKEIDLLRLGPPLVGHQFGFDELPQALKLFKSGKTTGKVVVNS
jgi:NADPH:quinone reductase-like Zn-dependent oxidoreductase